MKIRNRLTIMVLILILCPAFASAKEFFFVKRQGLINQADYDAIQNFWNNQMNPAFSAFPLLMFASQEQQDDYVAAHAGNLPLGCINFNSQATCDLGNAAPGIGYNSPLQ